jgi:hypothetical protein
MKKFLFCIFIVIVFVSCGQKPSVYENIIPEEKWDIMQEHYMVPDAPVSSERPLPNVLSEQEVLLKAADVAIEEGVLDPSYYAYQNYPELLNAKIEVPILVTDANSGEPDSYLLTAINNKGELLAEVGVNSSVNVNSSDFIGVIGFAKSGSSNHFITKREAATLIQSQFPGESVSEPMAITNLRLEDSKHSHMFFYWYFTVGDDARSAAGNADEYIIASVIPGYTSIPGGVSNRAAIGFAGSRGDFHLYGYRMAKLNKPLRLFNKLEAARSAGGASFSSSSYPTEAVGFTPVPLK